MKKTMKMLTAALLALACLPMPIQAQAAPHGWYGTADQTAFSDLDEVDVKGMFDAWSMGQSTDGTTHVYRKSNVSSLFYLVRSRENVLRFTLREDTDAAMAEVLEVLEPYCPGLSAAYDGEKRGGTVWQDGRAPIDGERVSDFHRCYEIYDVERWVGERSDTFDVEFGEGYRPDDAAADAICRALAARGLITSFYGWGETADYNAICSMTNDVLSYTPGKLDAGAVQAYLDEALPGWTLDLGGEGHNEDHIVPPAGTSSTEEIEAAGKIYEAFGITAIFLALESTNEPLQGTNALARPGDVTLDCEIGMTDVVAAGESLLGARALCDTEQANFDVDGDGVPSTTDLLCIYKYVLGITDTFG